MTDAIRYEVADRIATITIDRPEARNALDLAALTALVEALHRTEADDAVDVSILTATGSIFSAGLDLKALSSGEIDLGAHTRAGNPWPQRTKPMIAAVNGAAVTGALELVLNCDLAVASSEASFADTHARVGILPFWGLSVLLPRAVGPRNAALMTMTGNFVTAEQALAWGLVSEVVEPDDLGDRARRLALDIAGNDQPGVRAMLRLYRDGSGLPAAEAADLEAARAIEWQGEGFDAGEIARRFDAIKARGRAQAAAKAE
jgi:enoyl-CoA hydratase